MNATFIERKVQSCRRHLSTRSLCFQEVWGDESGYGEIVSFRLDGPLACFDIALMPSGLTELRQIDDDDESRVVLSQQAIPEFVIDMAKDVEVGIVCSHTQVSA